jgi:hypothetical protein
LIYKNNFIYIKLVKYLNVSILFSIIFIYIFGPVLNKFGNWFDLIFIFSTIFFLYKIKYLRNINVSPLDNFFILIFLYSIISIKILFYTNINLLSWSMNFIKPFRIIFTLYAGYFLANLFYKKKYQFHDILKSIYFIIIFHSLIIIIQFFNIEFRNFIYSYTTTGEFRSTFEYEFRMGGLSGGSGGAVLSTVQSLGLIVLPFLLKLTTKRITKILFLMESIIILVSIILTGRSGIYCILLFLPVTLYLIHGGIKTIKYTVVIFSISVITFLFINQLLQSFGLTEFYNSFYRTFDSFISLTETGKYENETVLILKDYILFPDLQTFLFGSNDALLNYDVNRNLDSDIGYVRNIFSFGIFGFILYILPFFLLLNYTIKKIKFSIPHKLLFVLLLIMAFFHSKESFLYVRMFWSIISLILGFILVENKNINKKVCVV